MHLHNCTYGSAADFFDSGLGMFREAGVPLFDERKWWRHVHSLTGNEEYNLIKKDGWEKARESTVDLLIKNAVAATAWRVPRWYIEAHTIGCGTVWCKGSVLDRVRNPDGSIPGLHRAFVTFPSPGELSQASVREVNLAFKGDSRPPVAAPKPSPPRLLVAQQPTYAQPAIPEPTVNPAPMPADPPTGAWSNWTPSLPEVNVPTGAQGLVLPPTPMPDAPPAGVPLPPHEPSPGYPPLRSVDIPPPPPVVGTPWSSTPPAVPVPQVGAPVNHPLPPSTSSPAAPTPASPATAAVMDTPEQKQQQQGTRVQAGAEANYVDQVAEPKGNPSAMTVGGTGGSSSAGGWLSGGASVGVDSGDSSSSSGRVSTEISGGTISNVPSVALLTEHTGASSMTVAPGVGGVSQVDDGSLGSTVAGSLVAGALSAAASVASADDLARLQALAQVLVPAVLGQGGSPVPGTQGSDSATLPDTGSQDPGQVPGSQDQAAAAAASPDLGPDSAQKRGPDVAVEDLSTSFSKMFLTNYGQVLPKGGAAPGSELATTTRASSATPSTEASVVTSSMSSSSPACPASPAAPVVPSSLSPEGQTVAPSAASVDLVRALTSGLPSRTLGSVSSDLPGQSSGGSPRDSASGLDGLQKNEPDDSQSVVLSHLGISHGTFLEDFRRDFVHNSGSLELLAAFVDSYETDWKVLDQSRPNFWPIPKEVEGMRGGALNRHANRIGDAISAASSSFRHMANQDGYFFMPRVYESYLSSRKSSTVADSWDLFCGFCLYYSQPRLDASTNSVAPPRFDVIYDEDPDSPSGRSLVGIRFHSYDTVKESEEVDTLARSHVSYNDQMDVSDLPLPRDWSRVRPDELSNLRLLYIPILNDSNAVSGLGNGLRTSVVSGVQCHVAYLGSFSHPARALHPDAQYGVEVPISKLGSFILFRPSITGLSSAQKRVPLVYLCSPAVAISGDVVHRVIDHRESRKFPMDVFMEKFSSLESKTAKAGDRSLGSIEERDPKKLKQGTDLTSITENGSENRSEIGSFVGGGGVLPNSRGVSSMTVAPAEIGCGRTDGDDRSASSMTVVPRSPPDVQVGGGVGVGVSRADAEAQPKQPATSVTPSLPHQQPDPTPACSVGTPVPDVSALSVPTTSPTAAPDAQACVASPEIQMSTAQPSPPSIESGGFPERTAENQGRNVADILGNSPSLTSGAAVLPPQISSGIPSVVNSIPNPGPAALDASSMTYPVSGNFVSAESSIGSLGQTTFSLGLGTRPDDAQKPHPRPPGPVTGTGSSTARPGGAQVAPAPAVAAPCPSTLPTPALPSLSGTSASPAPSYGASYPPRSPPVAPYPATTRPAAPFEFDTRELNPKCVFLADPAMQALARALIEAIRAGVVIQAVDRTARLIGEFYLSGGSFDAHLESLFTSWFSDRNMEICGSLPWARAVVPEAEIEPVSEMVFGPPPTAAASSGVSPASLPPAATQPPSPSPAVQTAQPSGSGGVVLGGVGSPEVQVQAPGQSVGAAVEVVSGPSPDVPGAGSPAGPPVELASVPGSQVVVSSTSVVGPASVSLASPDLGPDSSMDVDEDLGGMD